MRFAALGCLEKLAEKLGEEYMTLLPETIPFLAELMEGACLPLGNSLVFVKTCFVVSCSDVHDYVVHDCTCTCSHFNFADDSEEVELRCQEVVTSLEKLLGEPLQKYF